MLERRGRARGVRVGRGAAAWLVVPEEHCGAWPDAAKEPVAALLPRLEDWVRDPSVRRDLSAMIGEVASTACDRCSLFESAGFVWLKMK